MSFSPLFIFLSLLAEHVRSCHNAGRLGFFLTICQWPRSSDPDEEELLWGRKNMRSKSILKAIKKPQKPTTEAIVNCNGKQN